MTTVKTKLLEQFDVDLEKSGSVLTTSWTSNAGGAYTEAIIMQGWLVGIDFIPGAGGSQPSSGYDVTLIDSNGLDALATPAGITNASGTSKTSVGLDLSNSAAEHYPETNKQHILRYLNGSYTITIANAGNAKSGTIVWTIKNR